jgi:chorismate mutase/prephenate dehydratase
MTEATPPTLDALRQEIDKIDGKLHALIRARAEVVTHVARAKAIASGGAPAPAFRAAREAQVLRALTERHGGPFPMASLVRIWREMMSGMTKIQQDIVVAAHKPEKGDSKGWDIARDHFGLGMSYLPMRRARDVVVAVRDGQAGVGVLPAPGEEHGEEPWWPALAADSADLPRIVLKLPALSKASERPSRGHVALILPGPEPEEADAHYLAIEAAQGASRERVAAALSAAGVVTGPLLTAPDAVGVYLAEVVSGWTGAVVDKSIRYITPIGGYPSAIDVD